jgi:DNA-binding NarL/FixJ family response regulator
MPKASIFIVDDHLVVCAGLKALINTQPDMQVTGEANSGKRALAILREQPADMVLLDINLGDMSGIDVLRDIKLRNPTTRVLILSSYPEAQYGLNMLRAGAGGFIGKGADTPEMLRAIRQVMRGGRYLGPALAEQLVASVDGDPDAPLHGRLSTREFQIFCKLAQGDSVSAIAAKMFLSVKTVSTYRRRVLDKLSMKNNADLTAYAIRNELVH